MRVPSGRCAGRRPSVSRRRIGGARAEAREYWCRGKDHRGPQRGSPARPVRQGDPTRDHRGAPAGAEEALERRLPAAAAHAGRRRIPAGSLGSSVLSQSSTSPSCRVGKGENTPAPATAVYRAAGARHLLIDPSSRLLHSATCTTWFRCTTRRSGLAPGEASRLPCSWGASTDACGCFHCCDVASDEVAAYDYNCGSKNMEDFFPSICRQNTENNGTAGAANPETARKPHSSRPGGSRRTPTG